MPPCIILLIHKSNLVVESLSGYQFIGVSGENAELKHVSYSVGNMYVQRYKCLP